MRPTCHCLGFSESAVIVGCLPYLGWWFHLSHRERQRPPLAAVPKERRSETSAMLHRRDAIRVRGLHSRETVTPHPNPLPPQVGPARIAQIVAGANWGEPRVAWEREQTSVAVAVQSSHCFGMFAFSITARHLSMSALSRSSSA